MSTSVFPGSVDSFSFTPVAKKAVPYDDYLKVHDAILAIETALSIGAPTTYTVTWTNGGSIGNGTLTGKYFKAGKLVYVDIQLTAGSTTTFGSGSVWTFSLPVTAADANGQVLSAHILDSGVQFFIGAATPVSTSAISVYTNGASSGATSTVPHGWKSGDTLRISGWYRGA